MAPKVPAATADELAVVNKDLNARIDALTAVAATKVELAKELEKTQKELKKTGELLLQIEEAAKEDCQRVADDAHTEVGGIRKGIIDEIRPLINRQSTDLNLRIDDLTDEVADRDKKIRQTMDEKLLELRQYTDARFDSLKEELVNLIELRANQATADRKKQRNELNSSIEGVRLEAADDNELIRKELAEVDKAVRQDQAEADRKQDEIREELVRKLNVRCDEIDTRDDEDRQHAQLKTSELRDEAAAALDEFRQDANDHMAALDDEDLRLAHVLSRTQEVPTRSVEWCIENARVRCQAPMLGGTRPFSSWFSPKFHAAGAEDLQLELRMFSKEAIDAQGGKGGDGDCALFLWASKGMAIAARLTIGAKSANIEADFSDRMAHGTKRMCLLRSQVNEDDGGLKVGVELLEVLRQLDQPKVVRHGDVYGEAGLTPFEGSLLYRRSINNRILPQVQTEVERIQARLVRRIEWKIEEASALPGLFPQVHPICSPAFNCAGVEGLQLLFYPSGYSGATENFCSMFLFAPAGVDMKFRLIAGDQVRDCQNMFEEPGAYGRTNYCRFDTLPDAQTDSIVLALEVDEVTQELSAKVGESGNERVKMVRAPAKSSLVDIKPIPSMWSAKALGDVTAPIDGFHSFKEAKEVRSSQSMRDSPLVAVDSFDVPKTPKVKTPKGQHGKAGGGSSGGRSAPSTPPPPGDSSGFGGSMSPMAAVRMPEIQRCESVPTMFMPGSPPGLGRRTPTITEGLPLLCGADRGAGRAKPSRRAARQSPQSAGQFMATH